MKGRFRASAEISERWRLAESIALLFLLMVPSPIVAEEPPLSSLLAFGYRPTEGAAPGYVEDRACAICHRELFDAYQEVGMARSFAAPENARRIEDFEKGYVHEPSGRHYRMIRSDDGGMRFRRWQLDEEGQQINVFEQQVDWVLGSGHTSRVYLFRTPSDELYQLPLAWYSQDGGHWAMAPGHEKADHSLAFGGPGRRIRRECMFCHNAYPQVPAGSDVLVAPHTFPEQLPEGTGCQRCHGPGARHMALAFTGEDDLGKIRATVVNPADLPAARRDEVCHGCHMQPAVALMGVRRFGRGTYSLRPDEPLDDYLVHMEPELRNRPKDDFFEINHHPYRLGQSACFLESQDWLEGPPPDADFAEGASPLSCLSCHDPHRKVPVENRAAHYRAVCQSCHLPDACGLEAMRARSPEAVSHLDGIEAGNCVTCHMPRRRTQDVIHVVMTDHRITRYAEDPAALLAPIDKPESVIDDGHHLWPENTKEDPLAEAYRLLALAEATGSPEITDALGRELERHSVEDGDAWLHWTKARVSQRRFGEAEGQISRLLGAFDETPMLLRLWSLARSGKGDGATAIALMQRAVELDPKDPTSTFNLGVLLFGSGNLGEAEEVLRRAIELTPQMGKPRLYLARVLRQQGHAARAEKAYREALAAEPGLQEAYVELADLLVERGARDEALRWLRHGARWAFDPASVEAELRRLGP